MIRKSSEDHPKRATYESLRFDISRQIAMSAHHDLLCIRHCFQQMLGLPFRQPTQRHHLRPLDLPMLTVVAQQHLLVLNRAKTHLPCVGRLVAHHRIHGRRQGVAAATGVAVRLHQTGLGQRLQRALGAGRVTLNVPGQRAWVCLTI